MSKNLFLNSAFYSVGNMFGAGLNMLYQFVLIIFLNSEEYGIIQPLLQFSGLLLLPLTAYQYALTKHYSQIEPEQIVFESLHSFRKMLLVMIITALVWMMLIPVLKKVFHVEDTVIFIMLSFTLLLQMPQSPFISRMQAEKKFFAAGMAQISQGLTRMSLGILCVWKFPNIWGAMAGILISIVIFAYANIFIYQKQIFCKIPRTFVTKPFSYRLLWVSLGSVGLFSLLIYSDTVLVRSLIPSESALFASSNLLGKGMIFLTTGVSFVILPLMAEKIHDSKKSLWIGLGCLLFLISFYVGFFKITSPFLATVLFKNDPYIFQQFQIYMPYYNLMFIPYPLIYYFLNYYLVKESSVYPVILICGITLLYVGIFKFHANLFQIINVIGSTGYALLILIISHALFSKESGGIHEEFIDESAIERSI
ncbi:MAG: hypothetical protein ACRCTQ_03420 [Brevinemataceae bacterium]